MWFGWKTATVAVDAGMAAVAIGLGTNVGDRLDNLARAIDALRARVGSLTAVSRVYASEPIGFRDQPEFWNAVVLLHTALAPVHVLERTQEIEQQLGRVPTFRHGPRVIDLDLLLYDDDVVDTDLLIVPHPRLHERAFALRPLAELAASRMHPLLARSIEALRDDVAAQHAHPLDDATRRLQERLGLGAER